MNWLQAHIPVEQDKADALELLLLASGALSVTVTNLGSAPVLEPGPDETPLWSSVCVTGLFEDRVDRAALQYDIEGRFHPAPEIHWENLQDQAWERCWIERFQPLRCGHKLWICPSWSEPPEPNAINLMLDPGLAFGSGGHATTALCLEWLDGRDLGDKIVIDYGCGSGILAIAALLLGARHAVAVDIDPQALAATRENARRNGIDDSRLQVTTPTATLPGADVLVANILAEPLIELAATLASAVKPGGELCLSGMLNPQAEQVRNAFKLWFSDMTVAHRDEWTRISGTKKSTFSCGR